MPSQGEDKLRKPFLANQYSWVVATSNGWVEKQILDAIAEANPESTNQSLPTGSTNTGRPSDARAPVEITSMPSRADIEVNGAFSGMTPATKKLKEGTFRITVRKANYRVWERNAKIAGRLLRRHWCGHPQETENNGQMRYGSHRHCHFSFKFWGVSTPPMIDRQR